MYACYFGDSDVYQIDPDSGSHTLWSTGTIATGRAIACHPDGRVFIASNSGNNVTVYCLNASGGVIWSTLLSSIGLAYGIAVTNEDSVYVCTFFAGAVSGIYKLNATTGTQVIIGWPYTPGAPGVQGFFSICVDQSGNVYVGGTNSSTSHKADSLTPSGSVRWSVDVTSGALGTGVNGGVYGIAVNALGTQVHCIRTTDATFSPALCELYNLNASSGALTGAVSAAGSGGSSQNGNSATYDSTHNPYGGILVSTAGYDVYKNLGAFSKPGVGSVYAMACGHDDNLFTAGSKGAAPHDFEVFSVTKGWSLSISGKFFISGLDVSTGRMGAFGL